MKKILHQLKEMDQLLFNYSTIYTIENCKIKEIETETIKQIIIEEEKIALTTIKLGNIETVKGPFFSSPQEVLKKLAQTIDNEHPF